jgi:hypothetical protein
MRAMSRLAWVAALWAALPSAASGQGSCQVNGFATCVAPVTADATNSITFTITSAARLSLASTVVNLPAPTDVNFNSGLSGIASLDYTMRANTAWALSISASSALWSASPASARQDKPVGDLQWATSAGGTYTDMTTTPVAVSSGTATAGAVLAVWFRMKLGWTLDTPGNYSIPVTLIITAP